MHGVCERCVRVWRCALRCVYTSHMFVCGCTYACSMKGDMCVEHTRFLQQIRGFIISAIVFDCLHYWVDVCVQVVPVHSMREVRVLCVCVCGLRACGV